MNYEKSDASAPPADAAGFSNFENTWWRHAAPFIAWLFLMQMLGDPAGWKYGVRSAVCLVLFLALRPWRGYERPSWKALPLALGVGALVFFIWIAPESHAFAHRFPRLAQMYLSWGVMPLGRLPKVTSIPAYAPEHAGWIWAVVRWAGSAGVIAVIEEFFWRGFLYRWMFAREFMKVDMGRFHVAYFILVNFVFGLEHDRWLVGWVAGMAYGALAICTRNLWTAVFAHVITNYLLGLYVLATGRYAFW